MHRAFVPHYLLSQAQVGEKFLLPADCAHRFVSVLRIADGTEVEIFDGTGLVVRGTFAKGATPFLQQVTVNDAGQSTLPIVVIQAVIAMPKMEQVVQRSTELGATTFMFFDAQQSEVKWSERFEAKRDRLEKIAREASRQSGRVLVPEIVGVCILEDVCRYLDNFPGLKVVGDLAAGASLLASLSAYENLVQQGFCAIIGPEGDFSARELQLFNTSGAISTTWSPHVLRTETAALAAIAVAQCFLLST